MEITNERAGVIKVELPDSAIKKLTKEIGRADDSRKAATRGYRSQ